MSDTVTVTCNCGKTGLQIEELPHQLEYCHCVDCRKFTGANAAHMLHCPKASTKVIGTPKVWATTSDRGTAIARHFCGNCGSSLFDVGKSGDPYVHAGLLPPGSMPRPVVHYWATRMEPWEHRYGEMMETQPDD